jgi:hypothetical protein
MVIRKVLSGLLLGSFLASGMVFSAPAVGNEKVESKEQNKKEKRAEIRFFAGCKAVVIAFLMFSDSVHNKNKKYFI